MAKSLFKSCSTATLIAPIPSSCSHSAKLHPFRQVAPFPPSCTLSAKLHPFRQVAPITAGCTHSVMLQKFRQVAPIPSCCRNSAGLHPFRHAAEIPPGCTHSVPVILLLKSSRILVNLLQHIFIWTQPPPQKKRMTQHFSLSLSLQFCQRYPRPDVCSCMRPGVSGWLAGWHQGRGSKQAVIFCFATRPDVCGQGRQTSSILTVYSSVSRVGNILHLCYQLPPPPPQRLQGWLAVLLFQVRGLVHVVKDRKAKPTF